MRRFLVPQVECTPCLAWRLHENDIVTRVHASIHASLCLPMPTGLASVFFFFLHFVFNVSCCHSCRRLLHVETEILCRRSYASSPPCRYTCISRRWYVYDFVGKGCHSLFLIHIIRVTLHFDVSIYLSIETDALFLFFSSSSFIMDNAEHELTRDRFASILIMRTD